MTARRMLFAGDTSPLAGAINLIAPTGARVALTTGAYQAFPGMFEFNGNDLFLAYRYSSAHNSPGALLDSRVSTDGGLTWPGGGTTIQTAGAPNDLRDPAIGITGTGRFIVAHHTVTPWNSDDVDAYVNYSDDDGATWNTGSTYTLPTSYSGPVASAVTSPIIMDGTDVIIPGYAEDGGNDFAIYWRSTDDGATFASPTVIASSGSRHYQEPQIRILASGRWLCLMRSDTDLHTWRTYSDDDGSTWSTPDDVNAMTGRPDFIEYRAGRLVQVGRNSAIGIDSPPYFTVSLDDGATWSTPVEVDTGETKLHMYAALVKTADGAVTMAYALEASGSASSLFVRFLSDA